MPNEFLIQNSKPLHALGFGIGRHLCRYRDRQEARSGMELDNGTDHVQDQSAQTSRLAQPAPSPGQAIRLCLREKFAGKNCPGRERAGDGRCVVKIL